MSKQRFFGPLAVTLFLALSFSPRSVAAFAISPIIRKVQRIQSTPITIMGQQSPPSSMTDFTRLQAASSPSSKDDERTVAWTIANLFQINDTLLVIYHTAGTAWDNLVPFGALLGAMAYALGLYNPYPTLLQTTGDAAFWTGIIVMAVGVLKLLLHDMQQSGFEMSKAAQRLKGGFPTRVMDQSVWIGCGLASILLIAAGGPLPLGLAAGTDGVLQGLSLGCVVGSFLGWYRQRQGSNGLIP